MSTSSAPSHLEVSPIPSEEGGGAAAAAAVAAVSVPPPPPSAPPAAAAVVVEQDRFKQAPRTLPPQQFQAGLSVLGRQIIAIGINADSHRTTIAVEAVVGISVVDAPANARKKFTLRIHTATAPGFVDIGEWSAADSAIVYATVLEAWSRGTVAKQDPEAFADGKPIKTRPSEAQMEAAIARASAQQQQQQAAAATATTE